MSYNIVKFDDISFGKGLLKYYFSANNLKNPYGDYQLKKVNPRMPIFMNSDPLYFRVSFGKDKDQINVISFNVGGFYPFDRSAILKKFKMHGAKIVENFIYEPFSLEKILNNTIITINKPSEQCKTFVADFYGAWISDGHEKNKDWKEPVKFIKQCLDRKNGLNSQDDIKQNVSQFRHSILFRNVNNETQNPIMNIVESYVTSPELKPQ